MMSAEHWTWAWTCHIRGQYRNGSVTAVSWSGLPSWLENSVMCVRVCMWCHRGKPFSMASAVTFSTSHVLLSGRVSHDSPPPSSLLPEMSHARSKPFVTSIMPVTVVCNDTDTMEWYECQVKRPEIKVFVFCFCFLHFKRGWNQLSWMTR